MTAAVADSVTAYIGLGANLGDAAASIRQAIDALRALPQTKLLAASSLYASAPVDAGGDDYVNAVARIETQLDADALLQALQTIEQTFGRERAFRNAPRTLDLDLLLYGQEKMASATLEVPHPRMTTRAFVLLPLLELDASIQIPGKGAAAPYLAAVADQVIALCDSQAK
jgi:2-amino-4-hydroxy-6-hydroxymethyldihydropteridine diphosphokinase